MQGVEIKPLNEQQDSNCEKAVTKLGISLRAVRKLRELVEEHFGAGNRDVTTTQVVQDFVKVTTDPTKCRLAEMATIVDPEDVGRPMYFIEHAWNAPIRLLFDRVVDFLGSADDTTRVWIDILAVNQHSGEGVDHNQNKEDVAAFDDVLQVCSGGTIVVVDMQFCNPATRGWCLYEFDHTMRHHGPDGLHMPLSTQDRASMIASINIEKVRRGLLHAPVRR